MSERRHRLTPEEETYMRTLLAALEPFRAVNPTATLQQVVTFLLVAMDEGQSVKTYAGRGGMAQGVMTRNLLDLGELDRRKEPGLDLLMQKPNLDDRRVHENYLTHKGRAMVGAIVRALQHTNPPRPTDKTVS